MQHSDKAECRRSSARRSCAPSTASRRSSSRARLQSADRAALAVPDRPRHGANRSSRRRLADTATGRGRRGSPLAQELYDAGRRVVPDAQVGDRLAGGVSATSRHRPARLIGPRPRRHVGALCGRDKDKHWTWREARADGAAPAAVALSSDPGPHPLALDGRMIGDYALVGDERSATSSSIPPRRRAWNAIVAAYQAPTGRRCSPGRPTARRSSCEGGLPDRRPGLRHRRPGARAPRPGWRRSTSVTPSRHLAARAGPLQGRRRPAAHRLPDPAARQAGQGPAAGGVPARRPGGARHAGLRLVGPGHGLARLRGAAGQLPRLRRLGRELLEAGYGQWGRKMQTDLSDGSATWPPRGPSIPSASASSAAAMAAMRPWPAPTLDTGVYRCAVSVAGSRPRAGRECPAPRRRAAPPLLEPLHGRRGRRGRRLDAYLPAAAARRRRTSRSC
jgi:hypothetical protein